MKNFKIFFCETCRKPIDQVDVDRGGHWIYNKRVRRFCKTKLLKYNTKI